MNPTPGTARRALTGPRSSAAPRSLGGPRFGAEGSTARRAPQRPAVGGGAGGGEEPAEAGPARTRALGALTPLRCRLSAPGPRCTPEVPPASTPETDRRNRPAPLSTEAPPLAAEDPPPPGLQVAPPLAGGSSALCRRNLACTRVRPEDTHPERSTFLLSPPDREKYSLEAPFPEAVLSKPRPRTRKPRPLSIETPPSRGPSLLQLKPHQPLLASRVSASTGRSASREHQKFGSTSLRTALQDGGLLCSPKALPRPS